ncbi:MAG TPA: hypothetical protein DCL77_09015 [Prolixibacteraceae bacterium]|jgi:hypothetical protein|nr:hypothetical protein [Prolixibacteraceae bacterium]
MSIPAKFEIRFLEDQLLFLNTTNLSQTQYLGGEKLLLIDDMNLNSEQVTELSTHGFVFFTSVGDRVMLINKRSISHERYLFYQQLGNEVDLPTVDSISLNITFPLGEQLLLSEGSGLSVYSQSLVKPFLEADFDKETIISCANIASVVNGNPQSAVFTINGSYSPFNYLTFPDGVYIARIDFNVFPDNYIGETIVLNTDNVYRKILEKIDPSAGFYTQFRASESEKRSMELVSELLIHLEAVKLDFAYGYLENVKMKLGVINKLLKLYPIFKCGSV